MTWGEPEQIFKALTEHSIERDRAGILSPLSYLCFAMSYSIL